MNTPLMEQIKVYIKMRNFGFMYLLLFNIRIIRRIYSILTKLLVSHFGLEKVDAGMRTAGFIVSQQLCVRLVVGSAISLIHLKY